MCAKVTQEIPSFSSGWHENKPMKTEISFGKPIQ